MKGILEQGPRDLDAISRRAIRSYAMGQIDQVDCNIITTRVQDLKDFIAAIEENKEGEE